MTVARFGPYKISDRDGKIASSGLPVTVLVDSSGAPGAKASIFSDDAGTVPIVGQQESYVPDASGVTSGSESAVSTSGVVLTDAEGDITFVAAVGDYWLSWSGRQKPLKIELPS